MNIGVLGTGAVGQAIAGKLKALGHDVMMGARLRGNASAKTWAAAAQGRAGNFADAASFGEWVFNCTSGLASIEALTMAGADNLDGKILVDIANPLDFSQGFPPSFSVCNTDSLGEQIQRTFPKSRVVKTLNTVNSDLMIDPGKLSGSHAMFICGNDPEAKRAVIRLLESIGWSDVLDLGDITNARGTEQWLALWVRLYRTLGHSDFNIALVQVDAD